jgi:hypothetical protein
LSDIVDYRKVYRHCNVSRSYSENLSWLVGYETKVNTVALGRKAISVDSSSYSGWKAWVSDGSNLNIKCVEAF